MIRRGALQHLSRFFMVAAMVALFAAFASAVIFVRRPAEVVAMAPPALQTIIPPLRPLPAPTPAITSTPEPPLVALLAGHSGGSDPGAVCPDGAREVEITSDVARRARTLLEARGYRVDILAEFDPRLGAAGRDYSARVFLAIHADSCIRYASGYKVARAANSATPQEDDRLVHCVSLAYGLATQLPFHEGSITRDMTHYHGLMEINPQTPGAIIELGFLGSDKELLMNRRDLLGLGIADGIDRFLQGNSCQ